MKPIKFKPVHFKPLQFKPMHFKPMFLDPLPIELVANIAGAGKMLVGGLLPLKDKVLGFLMIALVAIGTFVVPMSSAHAAKLSPGQDPRTFYPPSFFMNKSDMQSILTTGAVWCMMPQGASCGFQSLVTGHEGDNYYYDVLEKWDAQTILSSPVKGTLDEEGYLCEETTGNFDQIDLTLVNGKAVKEKRFAEIQTELASIWADEIGSVYCYLYAITDPRRPEIITQYVFQNGEYIDNPINFIVDDADGAIDYYTLRDL